MKLSIRLLSAILAAIISCSCFGIITVGAEQVFDVNIFGDYEYTASNGEACIISYNGTDSSLTIPSQINGNTVTQIGESAFEYNSSLKTITIPSTVNYIDSWAFSDCDELLSISVPDSVTGIGYGVFSYCDALKSVNIGSGVNDIADFAFNRCPELKEINVDTNNNSYSSIDGVLFNKNKKSLLTYPNMKATAYTVPDGVKRIADFAFVDCDNLKSVALAESIESLGDSSFGGTALAEISIPASVINISYGAFLNCTSLKQINVNSSNKTYSSIGGVVFDKSGDTLVIFPAANSTDYKVPDGVKNIANNAFQATALKSVTLPASLENISNEAFSSNEFLEKAVIPNGVTSIGSYAFSECFLLSEINIPDSVTTLGDYAFYHCNALTDVTLGKGIKTIPYGAFDSCYSLKKITIPQNIESIDSYAFSACVSLETVNLPDGLTNIGDEVFYDCHSLKSITIPASVEDVGIDAFGYYTTTDEQDNYITKKVEGFTIKGYNDTAAENYAVENGFTFVRITDSGIMGDLDGNGKLSISDATYLQRAIAEYFTLTAEQETIADMNGDGYISINDVTAIQRKIAEY